MGLSVVIHSFSCLQNTLESGPTDSKSLCESVIGQEKQTTSISIYILGLFVFPATLASILMQHYIYIFWHPLKELWIAYHIGFAAVFVRWLIFIWCRLYFKVKHSFESFASVSALVSQDIHGRNMAWTTLCICMIHTSIFMYLLFCLVSSVAWWHCKFHYIAVRNLAEPAVVVVSVRTPSASLTEIFFYFRLSDLD